MNIKIWELESYTLFFTVRSFNNTIFMSTASAVGQIFPSIHPGRLTWNLQITNLERKMIFQTSMIMFHVNLQGSIFSHSLEMLRPFSVFVNLPVVGCGFSGDLHGRNPVDTTTVLGVSQTLVNNGKIYQPQLVSAGFLNHQSYSRVFWLICIAWCHLIVILVLLLNLSSVSSLSFDSPVTQIVSWLIMPHVFNYETKEFEQVHYNKVPQRTSREVKKRQRVSESMKFLLAQERTQTLREEAHAKLEASMKDWDGLSQVGRLRHTPAPEVTWPELTDSQEHRQLR